MDWTRRREKSVEVRVGFEGQNTQEREKSGGACRFRRGRARRRERRAEVRVGLEGEEHAGEREERRCVSVWKG